MTSAHPDLTVTVVSWNTSALLRACLTSIMQAAQGITIEVHVVDNASTDGSAEMVRTEFPHVLLLQNDENLGFAKANNQSWRSAHGRYWLLLNSDAEARPGALTALVQFMDRHERAGLASARLVGTDGIAQHCAQPEVSIVRPLLEALRIFKLFPQRWRQRILLGSYWTYDTDIRVGWTWGTALIARRTAVEQAGPLAEEFFMYGEDLEWSLRMRKAGWEIWFCAQSEVLHHGGMSAAGRWTNHEKARILLANVYKAIAMHKGATYAKVLCLANIAALGIERIALRIVGRPSAEVTGIRDCHRQCLRQISA